MIIGYDAKRAVSNNTGLGNYSRHVIEAIATENPEDSLLLYTPKLKPNPRLDAIKRLPNVQFRLPASQGFTGSLWRSFGITNNLRADKVELFHGLSNELPLNIRNARVPSVVTMHDVIYRRLPDCYKPIDRQIYDFKYGKSCRNADLVIAVSQRTADDVMEFYGITPDKIRVVYQGCDPDFKRMRTSAEIASARRRYKLPERYILQVGTIEKRKNLELTVRALAELPADIKLVVVGRDHYGYKKEVQDIAHSLNISDRILFLENLPFADLPTLNQGAEVVVYPSRYEGFGIPVLEGITSGRPVVAATGSCLEEAGGDGAIYVDPDSPAEMATALREITRGGDTAQRLIEAGRIHAAKFDINDIAANVKQAYSVLV